MKDYVIVTDVTSDIHPQFIQKYDIQFLPMGITLGPDSYMHYNDARELPLDTFYARLRQGETSFTSQVSSESCRALFTTIARQGKDVLYIAFSSGMSGSYESGLRARTEMAASHPDCRVEIIDSQAGCGGEGLLVYEAALQKQKGLSLTELVAWLESKKKTLHHWFSVQDLHHLKRGGRISAAMAFAGSLLGVKPILRLDAKGIIRLADKVRGWLKSIKMLVSHMELFGEANHEQTVFISHADCKQDAKTLADLIRERFQIKNIFIHTLNPIAGSHVGGGALGLFFFGQVVV